MSYTHTHIHTSTMKFSSLKFIFRRDENKNNATIFKNVKDNGSVGKYL